MKNGLRTYLSLVTPPRQIWQPTLAPFISSYNSTMPTYLSGHWWWWHSIGVTWNAWDFADRPIRVVATVLKGEASITGWVCCGGTPRGEGTWEGGKAFVRVSVDPVRDWVKEEGREGLEDRVHTGRKKWLQCKPCTGFWPEQGGPPSLHC